ncbi:integrator complex subunit 1 isoform X2 [Bacillus rossius redtenbacheri]|uniref:integrator complex subunit 1 isoform X2 n=1 Tax=Bacillus rossius redtenbacheri TaxID=93214 RepID=UPI002FDDB2CD
MDRGKIIQGRGGKAKTQQHPADLYVLGPKSSRIEPTEVKRPTVVHGKPGPSLTLPGGERKREAVPLPTAVPPKKTKLVGAAILSRVGSSGSSGGAEAWEMVALECEPCDLVQSVKEASDLDEGDRVVGLLCGAIRSLRGQRWKPDPVLYMGLIYLGRVLPSLFASDCVCNALCSLLRRDTSHSFKSKGNPLVPVLAANLLLRGFQDKLVWPESFIKLYVEDALSDRTWVDNEECVGFVSNIMTSIESRKPSRSMLQPDFVGLSACPSPSAPSTPDDDGPAAGSDSASAPDKAEDKTEIPVICRYPSSQENVETIVMEAVREQLNRRQPAENITRNFLRLLSATCGLVEVRLAATPRLEMWFQNPKLIRSAQELLMSVCVNCNTHTHKDVEVISHLVKIRLKTKGLISLYLSCIRELMSAHPDNLATLLKHTIYNELSNTRNPNNMAMLSVMFQPSPETAATLLADVFLEVLMNREDYLRSLRAVLREIVRVVRHDVNLPVLCRGLMDKREGSLQFRDFEFKERMFVSIVDLLTLCIFLGATSQVKEASSLLARGDRREIAVLQNFQMQVSTIQKEAVWWLYETVPRLYRPSASEFVHALHKVLFMEHLEQYYNKDMWPPEGERALLMRLASEAPLLQNSLTRILLIGLSKEHPLQAPDTLELVDQLLKRAAILPSEGFPMLQVDKVDIIDLVFNLTAYRHPENIDLPQGYCPPHFAVTNSYWKAWIMLLILSAHNPTTFGSLAWEKYPTLRVFMEMCITNHFSYPPPTMDNTELSEDAQAKELQMAAQEKEQILEFESYLAAASTKQTITEQTSLLLTQLITLDPLGPPRKPPQSVLDQLKALNASHRMGHLLCRSRHPDFLLDIIQRQGTSQSMPWLADLVENSEGDFSHLPVQCLCEFLLSSSEKQNKHPQLLSHLQKVLGDAGQDPQAACEVLEYFLRRLGSPQVASRLQAIKGLRMILSSVVTEDEPMDVDSGEINDNTSWLLSRLPRLPHFPAARPQVVQALRQACQVENDPAMVSGYISFLALHAIDDPLPELFDLLLDMAQLIVERSSIVAAICPGPGNDFPGAVVIQHSLMLMFYCYLQKAREMPREHISWMDSQDQILVTWCTGEVCSIHILMVHAIILLLCYGPGHDPCLFENLLEIWFPVSKEPPKGYIAATSQEAILIPDWLKLKMIRSTVDRLVDAALTDLEPNQLLLFIQSFGIPVKSMSKLLQHLDGAVSADHLAVAGAVMDKGYISQLVDVQHHRGASGGRQLAEMLQLDQPALVDSPLAPSVNLRPCLTGSVQSASMPVRDEVTPSTVGSILHILFGTKECASNARQPVFRSLQQTLASELQKSKATPVTSAVVKHLEQQCMSADGNSWIHNMLTRPETSCPLLRLITQAVVKYKMPGNTDALVNTCHRVLKHQSASSKSPLVAIFKKFLHDVNKLKGDSRHKSISSGKQDPITVLENTGLEQLERTGNHILRQCLELHSTEQLVQALAHLLVNETPQERIGLLIDWLDSLELELIGSCPSLQMKLLFGKLPTKQSCRPYLLTLLTHRAGWPTLSSCIDHLLQAGDVQYDPTAVLDFLWAMTHNPKLWQGREKFTPKNQALENVLQLTPNQLLTLVDYMLDEAHGCDAGDALGGLESRLPLLLQCLEGDAEVGLVARHLLRRTGDKATTARQFLLHLYLHIPAVKHHLNDSENDILVQDSFLKGWSRSSLDHMSHNVLSALTATLQSKDWNRRSQEYELMARKMASTHPLLVLRQLPMLAASLRGRAHLDVSVLRSRNHLNLFQQVMGILELLQPHVFLPEHETGLEDVLNCFFSLYKYHCPSKDLIPLLNRLVAFLQAYICHDAHRAPRFLQKYSNVLNELQIHHPNMASVRNLLSGISLPRTSLEEGGDVTVTAAIAPAPPQPEPPLHWTSLHAALGKMQGEDYACASPSLMMSQSANM